MGNLFKLTGYKIPVEEFNELKQGDKIKFKWYGNSELVYIGFIEIDRFGRKYFCSESNYYEDGRIVNEQRRFYNDLQDYWEFTEIEKI